MLYLDGKTGNIKHAKLTEKKILTRGLFWKRAVLGDPEKKCPKREKKVRDWPMFFEWI